jgi:hypothetical protein
MSLPLRLPLPYLFPLSLIFTKSSLLRSTGDFLVDSETITPPHTLAKPPRRASPHHHVFAILHSLVDPSDGFFSSLLREINKCRGMRGKRREYVFQGPEKAFSSKAMLPPEWFVLRVTDKNFRFLRGEGGEGGDFNSSRCIFLSTEEIHRTSQRCSPSRVFQCPNGSGLCRSDSPHKTSEPCLEHS